MDLAYVEMIEDAAGGMTSTEMVRAELAPFLNAETPPSAQPQIVDRDAWLRDADAVEGQAAMLRMVRGAQ